MDRGAQIRFPTLHAWMRNLLIALFVLYVLELGLRNAGVDVYLLAWQPFGHGFQPWQPLTRFLVQGPGVVGVIMGLVLLYFLLPGIWATVEQAILRSALLAGLAGGTLLPLLLDLAIAGDGAVMGWTTLLWVWLPTIFGLSMPNQTIYLMFVIPVNGRALLWFTAVICGLALLFGAGARIESAEPLGVWLGVYGWWQGLGPGARRRQLIAKAAGIERELKRFTVIEGGKGQSDGNRPPEGDEWVH